MSLLHHMNAYQALQPGDRYWTFTKWSLGPKSGHVWPHPVIKPLFLPWFEVKSGISLLIWVGEPHFFATGLEHTTVSAIFFVSISFSHLAFFLSLLLDMISTTSICRHLETRAVILVREVKTILQVLKPCKWYWF